MYIQEYLGSFSKYKNGTCILYNKKLQDDLVYFKIKKITLKPNNIILELFSVLNGELYNNTLLLSPNIEIININGIEYFEQSINPDFCFRLIPFSKESEIDNKDFFEELLKDEISELKDKLTIQQYYRFYKKMKKHIDNLINEKL